MSNHDREDKMPVIFAHRASKDLSEMQGEEYDKLDERSQSLCTEAYKDNFRPSGLTHEWTSLVQALTSFIIFVNDIGNHTMIAYV